MVRYYGYYSNVSRGKRKKQDQDEWIPCILEPDKDSKEYRKSWARLIQKIYEVDPLTCPKCQGRMRIITFIEDEEVIKKILKHLGVWEDKGGIVRDTYVSLPRHRGSNILYFSSQGVSDYFPATSRGKCLAGL